MNNKIIWVIVLIILIGVGAWWYTNSQKSESAMGTYAYTCANGSQFSMTPSEDVSTVEIVAGSQGMFTGSAMLNKVESAAGQRYEGTAGGNAVVFVGAGEEVQLTVGSENTVCNPVPNAEMAPWNWGDAGEGAGSIQPDASLVVTESIRGKWQSIDDAKFVRVFKEQDKYDDLYDDKVTSSGMWVAFGKYNAPEVPHTLEDNTMYIQMTETGGKDDTLYFKIVKLTPEELELIYLGRGNVLRFKSIE